MLRGVARAADGRTRVEIGSDAGASGDHRDVGVADGTRVTVGIRPQDCGMSTGAGDGICAPPSRTSSTCSSSGLPPAPSPGIEEGIVVQTPAQESYEPEQKVVVSAPPERVYLFDTDTGERLR